MGRGGVVMPQTLHGLPSISWQSILAKGKCHLEWAFIAPAKMQIKTIVTENWRVHSWSVVFSSLCGRLYSNHAADQPEVIQPFRFPWLRSVSLSPGLGQAPLMQLTHKQPTQMSSDWTYCIPTLRGPTVLDSLWRRPQVLPSGTFLLPCGDGSQELADTSARPLSLQAPTTTVLVRKCGHTWRSAERMEKWLSCLHRTSEAGISTAERQARCETPLSVPPDEAKLAFECTVY